MFTRLTSLFRDVIGRLVSELDGQGPEALLEAEKEKLRGDIAKYHHALALHADLCERLMAQRQELEKTANELRTKTTDLLDAGDREGAGSCALQLQAVQRALEDNRGNLEQAETSYRELLNARDTLVDNARAKLEALKSSLGDLKAKQAMAEFAETMSRSPSGTHGTLDQLTRFVNEERCRADVRIQLARDPIANPERVFEEFAQKAIAEQALIDFAEREGLALGDKGSGPQGEKPQQKDAQQQ